MLKKSDAIDARRYRAIRKLSLLENTDHHRFNAIWTSLFNDREDAHDAASFDVACDEIIEALVKFGVANYMES